MGIERIRPIVFCAVLSGTALFAACDSASHSRTPQGPASIAPSPVPPTPDPGDPLIGSFALTLYVGSGCPAVPETAATRHYTATIGSVGVGRYVVTLTDATFLTGPICTGGSGRFSGIGCDQFFASEDIDLATFFLVNNNDEAHGGHIVEQLSSGTWLEIIGNATGKLRGSSIEASGTSTIWYCRTPSAYPFPCSDFAACRSDDARLMFTRK
jgi:hypothetical protein